MTDEYEVVDHSEADIDASIPEDEEAPEKPDGLIPFDRFGAPPIKVVRVRDGVRDSEQR